MIIAILLVGRWNLKVVLISISQLSRDDELCSFFLSFFLYKYLLSFVVLVCLFVWELTLNFKFLMRPKSGLFWCLLRSCYFLPSDAEYASLANTINSHILHIFRSVGDCTFYKMPMLLITWVASLWLIDGNQRCSSLQNDPWCHTELCQTREMTRLLLNYNVINISSAFLMISVLIKVLGF